jgi:hypothetical protein
MTKCGIARAFSDSKIWISPEKIAELTDLCLSYLPTARWSRNPAMPTNCRAPVA